MEDVFRLRSTPERKQTVAVTISITDNNNKTLWESSEIEMTERERDHLLDILDSSGLTYGSQTNNQHRD